MNPTEALNKKKQDTRKKSFISWKNNLHNGDDLNDEYLFGGLASIGVDTNSLFLVDDVQKVRMYLSELVMKRHQCGIEDFNKYLGAINLLTLYAEYLECQEEKMPAELVQDKLHDSLTVAYFLSRADLKGLKVLGYKNFSIAFIDIGKKLNQKPSTIKNMRDEFDPYFENARRGWYQREMRASRKEVFDFYKTISDDDLAIIVKRILSGYSQQNLEEHVHIEIKEKHKTIKIASRNMKEIKAKRNTSQML